MWGVYGAALATCISYISVYVYRIIDTKKYVKINMNKYMIMPPVILLVTSLLLYIENPYISVIQILLLLVKSVLQSQLLILDYMVRA